MFPGISRKQLQAFTTLANCQTFAEAAEKLHVSQPALSISIKKLEQEIGGKLFARTTRTNELTPEGSAFLPVAERLLRDWDEAFSDLHNLFAMQRGKLALAAMPSFASSLLPDLLYSFHQQYPNINVSVQDMVMEQVLDAVRNGRAEIGFSFEADSLDGVEFYPLFTDSFIVLLPPAMPVSRAELTWRDLCEYPFVAMNRGSSIRRWCEQAVLDVDGQLKIVAEAGQLATIGQMVMSGLGVSVVPALCEKQMRAKGVRCLPLSETGLTKSVGLVIRQRSNLSSAARQFKTLALEYAFAQ